MASHKMKNSLRRKAQQPYYTRDKRGELCKKNPMRPGKTAEDKRIGSYAANLVNKAIRSAWQADHGDSKFPSHTCNGKRNRTQVTGKNNTVVML